MSGPLFPTASLPLELVEDLRRQNPWWEGNPGPEVPSFRRWPFERLMARLGRPIAPILVIRGPRQIGKTTLQQQIIRELLATGIDPRRILRVQFDELESHARLEEPILRIADWFERTVLGETLNAAAAADRHAFLFLDEVQNLPTWDAQLKSLVDHSTVRAMVTGSSALRIALGRDSLAGRIQSFEVGPLRLAEIASLRGFGSLRPAQSENGWSDWLDAGFWTALRASARKQEAVLSETYRAFSERGAYPFAQTSHDVGWPEVADYLTETVVKRVIEYDLRVGERGRKRDRVLLEAVFRMACRYVGEAPNPATLAREVDLTGGGHPGPQRVRHYIDFLDSSLLLRAIQPPEMRLKKRRGFAKLCLCDHALRAAWLHEVIPLDSPSLDRSPHLQDLAGRIAESVVGYYFASLPGLGVAHLPARGADPEVDFILTIGEKRIPVEVKHRRAIDPMRDTLGLRAFIEKSVHNAPFGLLVTRDENDSVRDPRILSIPLRSLLIVR